MLMPSRCCSSRRGCAGFFYERVEFESYRTVQQDLAVTDRFAYDA